MVTPPPLPSSPTPMFETRVPVIDIFSRALSTFQSSGSKFKVICTVPPSTRRDNGRSATPPPARPRTLIVLDSSFNPPTIAHLRMVAQALRDVTERQETRLNNVRLLLLLAINNADKAPKPAPFDHRLAMMDAFARDIQSYLSNDGSRQKTSSVEQQKGQPQGESQEKQDEGLNIDVALSTQPYFHQKTAAIAESDFYKPSSGTHDEMEQVILAGYDTLIRILNPKYYGPPTSVTQVLTTGTTATGKETQTPIQKALDPFFAHAKLRVTLRTDDEWGGKEDQLAYLEGLSTGDGLSKIGGSREWGSRIEMVEGRAAGEVIVSSTYAREAAKHRDWEKLAEMVSPEVRAWVEENGLYQE